MQKQMRFALFMFGSILLWGPARAQAAVTLLDKDDWKFSVSGFVETDAFSDSTRSVTEVIGNNPIDRPDTAAGQNGRAQFSIRNSRLAFTLDTPELNAWKTKAYLEFDLLGFDPSPGTAGNTEAGFFNNPTFRIRHAFLQTENDGWQVLAGQYWMLFGWQPYYFMSTVNVAPLPGMIYGRTAQLRGLKTIHFGENFQLQGAIAAMRPPQRDSSYPGIEAGVRFAFNGRTSGFTGGATGAGKAQPMSIGLSGLLREFSVPQTGGGLGDTTNYPGSALAINALIPVIASADGKDIGNTLSLLGEFTTGQGYGDQFPGWSGNIASPLSAATSPSTANAIGATRPINLDAGLGDYDTSGSFQLVHLRTFNIHFQVTTYRRSPALGSMAATANCIPTT